MVIKNEPAEEPESAEKDLLFLLKTGYSNNKSMMWERKQRCFYEAERQGYIRKKAEKIAGLSRFIHEFSLLSEADKDQIDLWNDYLVYAVVLEENQKIVKDISKL